MKYRYVAFYDRPWRSQDRSRPCITYIVPSRAPGSPSPHPLNLACRPSFRFKFSVDAKRTDTKPSRLTLTSILQDFKHIWIYHPVDSDTPIYHTRALIHQWHRNFFPHHQATTPSESANESNKSAITPVQSHKPAITFSFSLSSLHISLSKSLRKKTKQKTEPKKCTCTRNQNKTKQNAVYKVEAWCLRVGSSHE